MLIRNRVIAGSVNVPAMELVDEATHRYRPLEQLRAEFADVAARGERVITYCGRHRRLQ